VVFGRRREHYRQRSPLNPEWNGTFRWQEELAAFARKIVRLRGKALLLKSPWHTTFIPEIVAIFPAARFVMIFRNPVDQVRSLLAAQPKTSWCALQEHPVETLRRAAEQSADMLRRYLQTRNMVPAQNLTECTYESLVESPLAVLEAIHEHLRIPEFRSSRAEVLRRRVTGGYVRNVHPKLPAEEEAFVWTQFQPLIERGFYTPEGRGSG
jgi:omega-hydroxy-beta-dihydromenaquinone-9 sulfotransferase